MKKVLTTIITFIMVFCVTENAAAKTCEGFTDNKGTLETCDVFTKHWGARIDDYNIKYQSSYGTQDFESWAYDFTYPQNTSNIVKGYCIDPVSPASSGNYIVKRLLFDNSDESGSSYDAAIYDVLKRAFENDSTACYPTAYDGKHWPSCYNGLTADAGDAKRLAVSNVVRMLTFLYTYNYDPDITNFDKNLGNAFINLAIEWALEWNGLDAQANKLAVIMGERYRTDLSGVNLETFLKTKATQYFSSYKVGTGYSTKTFVWSNDNGDSRAIMNVSKGLFRAALDAAYDYVKNGKVAPNNKISVSVKQTSVNKIKNKETGEFDKKEVTLTIAIENSNNNTIIKYNSITCEKCSENGIVIGDVKYQKADGTWANLATGTNLTGYIKNGKIKVRFSYTSSNNPSLCANIRYKFNYSINNPNDKYDAAILWKTVNDDKHQRFVVIIPKENEISNKSFEGKLDCFKEVCDTEITEPVCTNNANGGKASVTSNQNVKSCIIDNTDEAGNSYQLSSDNGGVENSYCKIFCKEDYATIKFDGPTDTVECGGYFQLTARIEGKKDCYTAGVGTDDYSIDREQFEEDIANATSMSEVEKIVAEYNSCTTSWTNELKFGHKVKWAYDEEYYDLVSDNNKYLVPSNALVSTSETEVCLGNTDSKYNCTGNSVFITGNNYSRVMKNETFTVNGVSKTFEVSQAKFVRKTTEKKQNYITPTVFYQFYPSGTITTSSEIVDNLKPTPIVNGLPLKYGESKSGTYSLTIEGLGEFYDTGELGRIISYGSNANSIVKNDTNKFDGNYTCNYATNCTDDPDNPDDGCIPSEDVICPTCKCKPNDPCCYEYNNKCYYKCCPSFPCNILITSNIYNINIKVVSTTDFNSSGREYGYNWNINTTLPELALISDKAKETIDSIEDKNQTIYNDKRTEENQTLSFSITMTPSVTSYIKDYNAKIEEQKIGGYTNETLACYDYVDSEGNTHKNIFCYSTFIDELYDKFGSDVIYANNRLMNNRKENSASSGYWTIWPGYKLTESVLGGPSWK